MAIITKRTGLLTKEIRTNFDLLDVISCNILVKSVKLAHKTV